MATCGTSPTGVSSQPVTKGQRRKPGRSPACGLSGEAGGQQLSAGPVGSGGGQQLALAGAEDGGLQEWVSGWSGAAPGGAFGGQHPAFASGFGGQAPAFASGFGGQGAGARTRTDLILISFKAISCKATRTGPLLNQTGRPPQLLRLRWAWRSMRSVVAQSTHLSVMETPYFSCERSSEIG